MRFAVALILLLATALLSGCDDRIGEYVAASAISDKGFARKAGIPSVEGQWVRIWGFVDYRNLYGDADVRTVIGDLWSGDGPEPGYWRFNLKAQAGDGTGQSFAVRVPNDAHRAAVLKVFVGNARARRPTRVFLQGRLFTFNAPTNVDLKVGLYLELESSADIRFSGAE